MKTNNYLSFLMACLFIMTGLMTTSCGDDDSTPPAAPDITISEDALTAELGETVNVTVSGDVAGGFSVMRITKYLGTNIDVSYGTNGTSEIGTGLPFNFSYTIGTGDLDEPVRFEFVVEDDNGETGTVNLIITIEATRAQLLVSFDWRYKSLLFDDGTGTFIEGIVECEEDNIFSFEADGTMSVDYGALTGSGGGSCDGDGIVVPVEWEMDAAMETLYWYRDNDGIRWDTVTYVITAFDKTEWKGDEASIFGPLKYTYAAVPK